VFDVVVKIVGAMFGPLTFWLTNLDLRVVGSVNGHVGEPIPIDPQMIHSVAAASDLEFEDFLHSVLQHNGGTKCGI
jgi:hypothetical protein